MHGSPGKVPFRALLLSVASLAAPVMGMTLSPEWATSGEGTLLWLTALLPPFLMTYYRGWEGASIGLAFGMAGLVVANLAIVFLDVGTPNYFLILWITGTYIAVCVGAGFLGEVLRRQREQAEEMALTDVLTGMPNHRHARVFLDAAFSGAARGQPVSVVVFRLDQFDRISERFGSRTGDQVLRRFGAILTELTRRMDLSARWEGAQFISVLSRCKAGGAASFTTRVMEELRGDIFPWGKVTASAGIAEFEFGMGTPDVLIAAAERALHMAREGGGDQYLIAGTRSEIFLSDGPEDPSSLRGGLLLQNDPAEGLHLVPAPRGRNDGEEAPPPPAGPSAVALVVGSKDQDRARIVSALRKAGHTAVEASGAEHAIDLARKMSRLDLLVTDLVMAGPGGFTLVEIMQRDLGPLRVLYTTGKIQEPVSWRGAPGSRIAFVSRPIDDAELLATVGDLLEEPAETTQPAAVYSA